MKPPVPYFGSKARVAQWIVSLLPPHEHYVEPFAGGLSVLLAKRPSRMETVSEDLIAKYGAQPRCLLYVDPPYLGSTRGWGRNYRCEMKADDEHRELAAALAGCRAAVVLSGYHSPLYDDLYAGWHRYETATMTGNATTDKGRTEVIWSNRELGAQADLFGEAS